MSCRIFHSVQPAIKLYIWQRTLFSLKHYVSGDISVGEWPLLHLQVPREMIGFCSVGVRVTQRWLVYVRSCIHSAGNSLAVYLLAFPKDTFIFAVAFFSATVKGIVADNRDVFYVAVLDADYLFYDEIPRAIDVHCVYHKIRYVIHFLDPP